MFTSLKSEKMKPAATEDHKNLSNFIKSVHRELRESSKQLGAEEAWKLHLQDENKLQTYAQTMKELSINHWKNRKTPNEDRIEWTISCCDEYFKDILKHRENDLKVIERLISEGSIVQDDSKLEQFLTLPVEKLFLLDVGSCGNFFKHHDKFAITAIDIAPSSSDVLYCDFISVPIEKDERVEDGKIIQLKQSSFHVVLFSLLLEYMPSSEQRIKCCQQAYDCLLPEGILIIITPDSSNQHKNVKLLKNWRWLLAQMGFRRIKIEKLTNLSCLAFRKGIAKEISSLWAVKHFESYMESKFEIPQDREKQIEKKSSLDVVGNITFDFELMQELPNNLPQN